MRTTVHRSMTATAAPGVSTAKADELGPAGACVGDLVAPGRKFKFPLQIPLQLNVWHGPETGVLQL